jgi:hypothetical protein
LSFRHFRVAVRAFNRKGRKGFAKVAKKIILFRSATLFFFDYCVRDNLRFLLLLPDYFCFAIVRKSAGVFFYQLDKKRGPEGPRWLLWRTDY